MPARRLPSAAARAAWRVQAAGRRRRGWRPHGRDRPMRAAPTSGGGRSPGRARMPTALRRTRPATRARWPKSEARRRSTGATEAAGRAGPVAAARPPRPPRERFVETAYWNPSVVTGKDGKATRHVQGPDGPLRVPLHRPGRHRRRHPRRPDHGRPRRPQGLLRRPQGARLAHPGRQAPVLGRGPPRGRRPARSTCAHDLRRGPRGRPAEDGRGQGRRRRRGPVRAVRGPRRRRASGSRSPATLGRREGRADGRGADPPLGRAGVRLGLGHRRATTRRSSSACRRAASTTSPRCSS